MVRSRILIGATLAAVALAPAVADAKPRGPAAPRGPFFNVSGNVARTSVLTTRCPIVSALRATSIETTTTTYSYTFSGGSPKGRDRGGVRSNGETTYLFERQVEGESEYVKPETIGPSTRKLGSQEAGFSTAVRRVRDDGRRWALSVDFGTLAGGLRHTMTLPVPRKGSSKTYPIAPTPVTRRDPRPAPGCTHSEVITIRGSITVGQR